MSTWMDRLRGISQGRVRPQDIVPADGEHVFILGEENPSEVVSLMSGDHSQVSQIVNLTNYDFVGATMDTIGRARGQSVSIPVWPDDPAELFKFTFDVPGARARNLVIPAGYSEGFSLDVLGDITHPRESYSGADTHCIGIPSGTSAPTGMVGVHSPPVATPKSTINQYTLQVWANFDVDARPSSSSIDLPVLSFIDNDLPAGVWGVGFQMVGLAGPGAHQWFPSLVHANGASVVQITMADLLTVDTNQGWQMYTFTYDDSLPLATQLEVYLDDTPLGNPLQNFGGISPSIPGLSSQTLQYGDQDCWGQLDACRLMNRVLSPSEVTASHAVMTSPGPVKKNAFIQQIVIDGRPYAERTIIEGESRRWTDFVAPVRRLTGEHDVTFRMEAVEV